MTLCYKYCFLTVANCYSNNSPVLRKNTWIRFNLGDLRVSGPWKEVVFILFNIMFVLVITFGRAAFNLSITKTSLNHTIPVQSQKHF